MVAQFRLDKPNMSFVNVNRACSTTDEQGRLIKPVRGSILRGATIPDLMSVDSGLSNFIMGGTMRSDDSVEADAPPPQSFGESSGSNVSSTSGSGSREGPNNVSRSCSFSPTGGQASYADESMSRSHSTGGDALIMRRQRGVSARKQVQTLYQTNNLTLVRATSTIEISNCPYDNNNQHPRTNSSHSPQTLNPNSLNQSNYFSDGSQNESNPSFTPRMGQTNPNAIRDLILKQEYLRRENENLRRENLNQKRKLQEFAKTFNNPEKLQKVVTLLAQKRNGGQ